LPPPLPLPLHAPSLTPPTLTTRQKLFYLYL
jgi:hypothetical protein